MTKKTRVSSDDDEDEGYYCLVCMESYGTSRPGDDWVAFGLLNEAHEACAADRHDDRRQLQRGGAPGAPPTAHAQTCLDDS
ncbi:hypothetical protein EVAR_15677_1 [Eumeta japonica]|uniref:Uncharacterized protein n=1 Tax=Eumeta variegata TaxID=151549 RepID=A0A4C1U985_EUMVA|nr:hypothetical protein EVAR_15677_1 [Eumeta japonica]